MDHLEFYKAAIKQLKPELEKKYAVSSIGIFGSLVRNDFSPAESDIDLVVDFTKPIGVEFIDLANYLESKLNRSVDLVSVRGIKPTYLHNIQQEVVYV